jgi:hypothetical protein
MPEVKRSRPKRNQKRGPKKERLIIDIDPEEAMKTLLRKARCQPIHRLKEEAQLSAGELLEARSNRRTAACQTDL